MFLVEETHFKRRKFVHLERTRTETNSRSVDFLFLTALSFGLKKMSLMLTNKVDSGTQGWLGSEISFRVEHSSRLSHLHPVSGVGNKV